MTRVLIADDRSDDLRCLDRILAPAGYVVECANDGAKAMARARVAPPDVVIADLLAPAGAGHALLQGWKNDPQLRSVPFVFHAGDAEPDEVQRALDSGADAVVLKSAGPEALLARLREILARLPADRSRDAGSRALERASSREADKLALIHSLEQRALQFERANRKLQTDIAECAKSEQALRLLNAIALQSTEAILITDARLDPPGPGIVFVNRAFTEMTGYSADEVLGRRRGSCRGRRPTALSCSACAVRWNAVSRSREKPSTTARTGPRTCRNGMSFRFATRPGRSRILRRPSAT